MAPDRSRELDAALSGSKGVEEEEVARLVDVAESLRAQLTVDAPDARSDRAFFVNAVAARRRAGPSLMRLAVPALAVASVLLALGVLSRSTLPGDPLYPVRRVLQTTGVTRTPVEDVDRLLGSAERSIERGERLRNERPAVAEAAALSALSDLTRAGRIAREVQASERLEEIGELTEEASDLLQDAREELAERLDGDDSGGDDSGSGGNDDNSGSGSDDSGADDSGSGGDDNSGSGSVDSGGDDSGSGGDDDNSGSGSNDRAEDDSGSEGRG